MEDFDISIKVLVVGNGGVGKTSLIKRFCKGTFTDIYQKTIGVDFLEKQIYLPSSANPVTLMLWDTAGQEEFNSLTKNYYGGAGAAVLVFSTVDRQSFEDIVVWHRKIMEECGNIVMVLIQNKADLIESATMNKDEAEAMASKLKLRFYRVSVKDNLNVKEVFEFITQEYEDNAPVQGIVSASSPATPSSSTSPSPGDAAAGEPSRFQLRPTRQRGQRRWSCISL